MIQSATDAPSHTDIKRSKPLKYAYEKEIVLYAHHKNLDYFSTECIYSPEAFRGSARALIKNLERIRPSAILDVVRSGEDMAKLVPATSNGSCADGCGNGAVAVEQGEGGCGSANTRSSGGEMAEMERQLNMNNVAAERNLEVEIRSEASSPGRPTMAAAPKRSNKKPKGNAFTPRKVAQQTMGQCARCGYLSSQTVCKACTLLEGLNKSRPKKEIEIHAADSAADTPILEANGAIKSLKIALD